MSRSTLGTLRWFWFQLHLWLGVALSLVLIPLCLSGSYLVWREEFDQLLHPARYAVTDPAAKLAPSAYLAAAQGAFGDRARAATLRLPETLGEPVLVSGPIGPPEREGARGEGRGDRAQRGGGEGRPEGARPDGRREGGPPPRNLGNLTAWIDPGTGKVLEVANPRGGVMIFMHDLHGSLFLAGGLGRKIVGWLGWAMLASSLTGIWLWWPKNGKVLQGFRWRRSPSTLLNLHYLTGFWIAIPLAILSLTGALISFPQTTRAIVGAFQPLSPQQPRPGPRPGARPLAHPQLEADAVVSKAQAIQGGRLLSLNLPSRANPVWRVEIEPASGPHAQIAVEDETGAAKRNPPPKVQPAGDNTVRFNRRLHDGIGFPMLWRIVITLGGLIPALLGVTGVIVWAQRQLRKSAMRRRIAEPAAAE
jgi:uncharacterized iron-regulated membrane protein